MEAAQMPPETIAEELERRGRLLIAEGEALIALSAQLVAPAPLQVIEPEPEPEPVEDEPVAEPEPAEPHDPAPAESDEAGPKPVSGSKGKVTLLSALETANRVGTFTRRQFADELGISKLAVSSWVDELEKRGMVSVGDDGLTFTVSQFLGGYLKTNEDALRTKSGLPPLKPKPQPVEAEAEAEAQPPVAMPENLTWMPAAQRGGSVAEAQAQKDICDYMHVEGRGPSSCAEVADALGADSEVVAAHMRELDAAGHLIRRGVGYLPSPPKPTVRSSREDVLLAKVREFVITRDTTFSINEAEAATELPREVVLTALRALEDRGVVADESPAPDMLLFRYTPYGPGKPTVATAEVGDQATKNRGATVAGVGQKAKIRVSNPDVRKLLDDAEGGGATWDRAADGHYAVIIPPNPVNPTGKRVLISSTPRSGKTVAGDRARLRREGLWHPEAQVAKA